VAAFTVAGGQGTRLGYDGPKGTFPVTPLTQKPLFRFSRKKSSPPAARYGRPLHWFIMTSHANHAATEAFFRNARLLRPGRRRACISFRQGRMPAVNFDGKIMLETKARSRCRPTAMAARCARWSAAARSTSCARGHRHLSYFQVDNPLVRCIDPAFIGWHVVRGSEMSSKMVPKAYAEEKVGHFCAQRPEKPSWWNTPICRWRCRRRSIATASCATSRAASRSMCSTANSSGAWRGGRGGRAAVPPGRQEDPDPRRRGRPVKPEKANGVKFEMFVFDALPFARAARGHRDAARGRFLPGEECRGGGFAADVPRRPAAAVCPLAAGRNGAAVAADATGRPPFAVEVSPLFGYDEDSFADAWRACRRNPPDDRTGLLDLACAKCPAIPQRHPFPMSIHTRSPPRPSGPTLASTAENLAAWLAARSAGVGRAASRNSWPKQAWSELNDRFYRYLEFGTGRHARAHHRRRADRGRDGG
jgi:UDP-N-acetylglucosamine/UDP-N-acetylgalactosamine diphosphorylase